MKNEEFKELWPEWELEEEIGRGSDAVVYEAHLIRDPVVKCAFKRSCIPDDESEVFHLLMQGYSQEQVKEYFQQMVEKRINEIKLLLELKNTGAVVDIKEYRILPVPGSIRTVIYIRMELLQSLESYLSDRNITEEQIVRLGITACEALITCEAHHVIHRDIKPANLFIDVSDPLHVKLKLGDFGESRQISETVKTIKGTPSYMAPEVFLAQSYDCRADIYSLGITLYQYLNSRRTPFLPVSQELYTPAQREEAFRKRISGEHLPPPIRASEPVSEVILKACAFRKDKRYENAEEFQKALQKTQIKEAEGSQKPGFKKKVLRWTLTALLVCLAFWAGSALPKNTPQSFVYEKKVENIELFFMMDEFVRIQENNDEETVFYISNTLEYPLNLTVQAVSEGKIRTLRFYNEDYKTSGNEMPYTPVPFINLHEDETRQLWRMNIQYPKPVNESYIFRVCIDGEWHDTDFRLKIQMEE